MKKIFVSLLLFGMLAGAWGQILSPGHRYAQEGMEYYQRGNYDRAIREFLNADKSAGGKMPEYHYWLGRLHIAVADTTEAMVWFSRYVSSGDTAYKRQVDNYLRIVQRQKQIFSRVSVRPLPDYVNSANSDYGAIPDPQGKYLYFTSLRPAAKAKENIWRTEIFSSGFGRPELVKELSTDKNEAFGCFSEDPPGAWIFGNYEANKRDGDIYFVPQTDKWFQPQNVTQLNTSQVETQPMVFRDRLLFFTSSREGGFGGTDIYVSEKIGGYWTEPQNLGPMINTSENEQTPFLDWDGKTLYFASNGHPGFGGYDIFKAYKTGPSWQDWSLPENLGLPINSTRNDRYFYHARGSNEGYISSDRQVSGFEKIYQISFTPVSPASYLVRDDDGSVRTVELAKYVPLRRKVADEDSIFDMIDKTLDVISSGLPGPDFVPPPLWSADRVPEAAEEALQQQFVRVSGNVKDQSGNPVQIEIRFNSESEFGRNIEVLSSDASGAFKGNLPLAESYEVVVNSPGYLIFGQKIPFAEGRTRLTLDIPVHKLEKKTTLPYANILFKQNSAELSAKAAEELDLLALTLLTNPDLKVKLAGHADDGSTANYNKQVSELRARVVADYLIDKGIPKKRISWKAYGSSKPLDDAATPDKNRRVEINLQM